MYVVTARYTGSEVNIVKNNILNYDIVVDKTQIVILKGINDKIIQTIGKLTIPLIIQGQEISTEFNLVDENFPIRKNGILGNSFLSENNAVINLANKTLVINANKNEQKELLLTPRSETIVSIPIAANDVESKYILIHKQEIMEGIFCGSVINTVQNGEVIISILNITEKP